MGSFMMAFTYHGTPLTPNSAFRGIMAGRGACISFYRPDQAVLAEEICPFLMYDNGAFSFWKQAMKAGQEWDDSDRDWSPFFAWLEERLFHPGRWAVIPDRPGAPSQLNDALLNEWPFGPDLGAPLWHMDGPLDRLARLCDRYARVCLGWIGDPKREPVGCDGYRRKMDEVAALLGNRWPPLHMMRGVAVAGDYPFLSADSTSLAQNGHRYDHKDRQWSLFGENAPWSGRREYADRLERKAA